MRSLKQLSIAAVLLSVFLIPFYFFRFSLGGIRTNIFELSVIFSAVIGTAYGMVNFRQPKFGSAWPYLLSLAAFASIFAADDLIRASGIFKGWFLIPTILYFLIINNFKKNNYYLLLYPVFIALAIISLWGIGQRLGIIHPVLYQVGDISFAQYLPERVYGPFESPNYLAMYLVANIFLSLIILPKFKRKFLFGTVILLALISLYLTKSNGGIVALFFGAIFYLAAYYYSKLHRERGKTLPVFGGLTILALLGVIAGTKIIDLNSGSNMVRREIYQYALEILKANYIFGIGPGSFQETVAKLSINNLSFQLYGLPYAIHPHNLYLALWLNLGLMGLLIFLVIVYRFFKNINFSFDSRYYSAGLVGAMAAILAHGFFDTTYFKNDLSAIFWLIAAIGLIKKKND